MGQQGQTRSEAVEAFITKIIGAKKEKLEPSINDAIYDVSRVLQVALNILEPHCKKETGIHRLWLLLEEVDELTEGIICGNEITMLDALADISYIVEGTAVIYDLPLAAAFWEVQRSNMTKNSNAKFKTKDKGKGQAYSPPNLTKVLKEYRNGK